MINITPELLNAFQPHRNVFSLGDVGIQKVSTVYEAFRKLKELGLPISNKVIANYVKPPYFSFHWKGGYDRHEELFSYDFIQTGTEDDRLINNIAHYIPTMNSIQIFFDTGKETVGRPYYNKDLRFLTFN